MQIFRFINHAILLSPSCERGILASAKFCAHKGENEGFLILQKQRVLIHSWPPANEQLQNPQQ